MDNDFSQPQRVPVELDMDKARQQLSELSDEFQTLLTQAFRMSIKRAVEEQSQSGGVQASSMTSDANIDRIMAGTTDRASLDKVERGLDDIKGLLAGIQGLLGRPGGSILK